MWRLSLSQPNHHSFHILIPPWKLKCCVSVETDELALSWRASGESEGKKARTTNQEEKAFANPPIVSHLCRLSHPMLFMCTKLTIKCMYHCTVGFALKKAGNRQNISFQAHFFWKFSPFRLNIWNALSLFQHIWAQVYWSERARTKE